MVTHAQADKEKEKKLLSAYIKSALFQLCEQLEREKLPHLKYHIQEQEIEIDAKNPRLPRCNKLFTATIPIQDLRHIKIFREFIEAVEKHFSDETNGGLGLSMPKRGRSMEVTINYPGGLARLYNIQDYIDEYIVAKDYTGIRGKNAVASPQPIGTFTARIAKEKKAPEPRPKHELPHALGEILDMLIEKMERRIKPAVEEAKAGMEKIGATRITPFKFRVAVPLNITDWRDQLHFINNMHKLMKDKLRVNTHTLQFHVLYPPGGSNLCFVGPQLQGSILYPSGLKLLKELRSYIQKHPDEITPKSFPLLHEPARPPSNARELMIDLLDYTQVALKDLHTKLVDKDKRFISEFLTDRHASMAEQQPHHVKTDVTKNNPAQNASSPTPRRDKKESDYAQAVLKYESANTADIFLEILKSLINTKDMDERRYLFGIMHDFFHPQSLEEYTDEAVAEDVTRKLCMGAFNRMHEIGTYHNPRAASKDAHEIKLTHRKNGSLQALAHLLSFMFADETLREKWIERYAERIYKSDHLNEAVRLSTMASTLIQQQTNADDLGVPR